MAENWRESGVSRVSSSEKIGDGFRQSFEFARAINRVG
jgi:hypothetical protein